MKQVIQVLLEPKFMIRLANIVLIVVLAYFCAMIVSIKFENMLEMPTARQVRAVTTYASQKDSQPITAYNQILQRNIFNSQESISLLFDNSDEYENFSGHESGNGEFSSSSLLSDILLRGTLYTQGDDSMAVFELKSARKQVVVRTGSEIINGIFLESVFPFSVTIKRNGKLENLPIHVEKTHETGKFTVTKTKGIRQRDTNRFEIDKDTLNKNLENVNQIISQIAMRPKMESGVCIGYEIRRIKNGSIFQDIGLQRGDILQSVNGMDLSNPEDAFRVYKSLIGETSFNIDLMRDGQRTSLNYEIR